MAANVCGPAFGYLKAGQKFHQRGIYGLMTAAEVIPVVTIDGRCIGSGTPGPITMRLSKDFHTLVRA